MTALNNHQSLVNDYQELAQTVQRFRMYAFSFQAGIWIILFCLKYLQVQHLNLIATILFGLFLATRVRDFNLRRNLDVRMTQITLEGIMLEQKNPRLETFFHEVLQQFGIIRVMVLRAIVDVIALFFFCGAVYQMILDFNPTVEINIKTFYPVLAVLGFFMSNLYYKPLKALMKAKQEVA